MSRYLLVLYKDNARIGSYHLDESLFEKTKEKLKPYRSFGPQPKPIKCIETGEIFRCANDVAKILHLKNITTNYKAAQRIKLGCKSKKTVYGYHWEFIGKEYEE